MTIIYFILILSTVVAVHEFGHFIFAKIFGVYVQEYSIGFGPAIFKHKGKETTFSIRCIPLGGYNKMVETEEENQPDEDNPDKLIIPTERTFYGVHPLKRICILLAGPLFNLLLAFIVFMGLFASFGEMYHYPEPIIDSVTENSPAYISGLKSGDEIIKIEFSNGDYVHPSDWYEINVYCSMYDNDQTRIITVKRDNQEITVQLNPIYDEESQSYIMGISSIQGEYKDPGFFGKIWQGAKYTITFIKIYFVTILNLFRGIGLENVGGTVAIYQTTKEAASYGIESLISLAATLSISLGMMNLIPIPTLDGGRILLTTIELIIGHRLNPKIESTILNISSWLIILLFILITLKDIIGLF